MKTILVTGASSGIGRALAIRAARAGYAVYAVGRNIKALVALAGQVSDEEGMIKTDVTDVSDPAHAPALVGRMLAAYGHVDIVVNNAGAVAVGPIAAQSDEELRLQFGTHVIGPLALVREALPSLHASRGHVFMIGSGVARVPIGGLGAYPPSKAALRSATSILRRELTPLEIAVTYVDPGAVDTSFMTRAGLPGAPQSVLVSPELVARKILLAIGTRPRVLNVAPLQTAAVAVAELLPGITEAILERNPSLTGSGPALALDVSSNGCAPKIALPASPPLPAPEAAVDVEAEVAADVGVDAEHGDDPDDGDENDDPIAIEAAHDVIPTATVVPPAPVEPARPARWTYEPPDAEEGALVAPHEMQPALHEDDAAHATSSFDAAIEPLRHRMQRSNFAPSFVSDLLVPDAVLDVGETAMRWAGMPNKHERSLTSEVFFALAEWGFLAPRADGRYRVIKSADEAKA